MNFFYGERELNTLLLLLAFIFLPPSAAYAQEAQGVQLQGCKSAMVMNSFKVLQSEMQNLDGNLKKVIEAAGVVKGKCASNPRIAQGNAGAAQRKQICITDFNNSVIAYRNLVIKKAQEQKQLAERYAAAMASMNYNECATALKTLYTENWSHEMAVAVNDTDNACRCSNGGK